MEGDNCSDVMQGVPFKKKSFLVLVQLEHEADN
jgi:hypothetical protein